MNSFRYVIISDTHIRSENETHFVYPSDKTANQRHKVTLKRVNALNPEFVIHLGDVVHPIQALQEHENSVRKAHELYSSLSCPIHVTPGNHDIGDKPNSWVPAPVVTEESHRIFEKYWGAHYKSFHHQNCLFVIVNTSLLNSGIELEKKQEIWLENLLEKNTGSRIFMFSHYSPFINEPQEEEHYDNIAEPARSRWLNLLETYQVEAVFSGHAHNFFYNRYKKTDLYVLPSTTFVRPDYSELFNIEPGKEFGRYDENKLNFCEITVFPNGFRPRLISCFDKISCPGKGGENQASILPAINFSLNESSKIGVTMRHSWAESKDLSFDNLDEFARKKARNDLWLPPLWQLGVKKIRIPLFDFLDIETNNRISTLVNKGFKFTVFSIGKPSKKIEKTVIKYNELIDSWEIIIPAPYMDETLNSIREFRKKDQSVKIFLSKIDDITGKDEQGQTFFEHFPGQGFRESDFGFLNKILTREDHKNIIDGLVFNAGGKTEIQQPVTDIQNWIKGKNLLLRLNAQLPRMDEGFRYEDDHQTGCSLLIFSLFANMGNCFDVYIDTYIDHDRGYNARNGILDRSCNPRLGYFLLSNLNHHLDQLGPFDTLLNVKSDKKLQLYQLESAPHLCWLILSSKKESGICFERSLFDGCDINKSKLIHLATGEEVPDHKIKKTLDDGSVKIVTPLNPTGHSLLIIKK